MPGRRQEIRKLPPGYHPPLWLDGVTWGGHTRLDLSTSLWATRSVYRLGLQTQSSYSHKIQTTPTVIHAGRTGTGPSELRPLVFQRSFRMIYARYGWDQAVTVVRSLRTEYSHRPRLIDKSTTQHGFCTLHLLPYPGSTVVCS